MALFRCTPCGIQKEVSNTHLGKKVRCPSCKRIVTIVPNPLYPPTQSRNTPLHVESASSEKYRLTRGGVIPNILSGLANGALLILFALTFSQLIEHAVPSLPVAHSMLGMALTASIVFCATMALKSMLPVVSGGPETTSFCMLFLFSMQIHTNTTMLAPENILATLVSGIILCTLITGTTALLIANFGASHAVRRIPQPVTAGLSAGVGLVLLRGGLDITLDDPICLNSLIPSLHVDYCLNWLPALGLGILLLIFLYRKKNTLTALILLLAATGASLGLYMWWGIGPQKAHELGILLSPVVPAFPWEVLSFSLLQKTDWHVLAQALPYTAGFSILLMSTLADQTYELERILEKQIDLHSLLDSIGTANVISGLFGALPGSISINSCGECDVVQKHGALSGIVAALLCASAFFWLAPVIELIPRFIPAAICIFLGMNLIRKGFFNTQRTIKKDKNYGIILSIFFSCMLFGMFVGIATGLFFSLMLLANHYNAVSVIKHKLSGSSHRSRVDRGAEELSFLHRHGDAILLIRLQGFIFLGCTAPIMQAIHSRLLEEAAPLQYLILDFSHVSGLGPQADISFLQLRQLAKQHNFLLIFTSIPFELEQTLENYGILLHKKEQNSMSFIDTDYAFEWCENRILEALPEAQKEKTLPTLLKPIFPEPDKIPRLLPFLEKIECQAGEYVFKQGEASNAMYFIESGMVTIELQIREKKTTRLKKMGPGTVFGEMGIYTETPRSASAKCDEKCVMYRLHRHSLDLIQNKDPHLLSAIHRFVVNLLATRITEANRRIFSLLQ